MRTQWTAMARTATLGILLAQPFILPAAEAPEAARWQKRWVYLSSNLYVNENLPKIEQILRRAAATGYNGVLFTDYKTGFWWKLDSPQRWQANAQRLRQLTRDLKMDLVVCVFPFGYAGSLLWNDPNLAAGMPVKDAPLVARNSALEPEPTAAIRNGSFEEYKGDQAVGFSFQDGPGKMSFIDSQIAKDGKVSIRFENFGRVPDLPNGRVVQEVAVKPWQQYRLRVWMKTEGLTAEEVKVMALVSGDRTLQWQHLKALRGGKEQPIGSVRDLTTDWVEQRVTFNSLDNTAVRIYVGAWGGKAGRIWWDDLRIESVPTLNVLRRERLPLSVVGEDGTRYDEGRDFEPLADPAVGKTPWSGSFETRHEPPAIRLTQDSRIREGQRVLLSCYHPTIVYDDQVNCSLEDPKVFDLCQEEAQKAVEAFAPDGLFMSHDEIRCAGWEPKETEQFKTTGELLAFNIRRCYEIAAQAAPGKPVFVWSDMFDPNHNARANYYLANNTWAGSWEGLDTNVIVMKWGSGKIARPGLEFFAGRGHQQMIAAYYDRDVDVDFKEWSKAAESVPHLIGVMYTTWKNDYSNLEKFARAWWGRPKANTE
ncbi:MAG: hypothetical protein NTW86_29130 [Candidatus Sumerlaeota bacterium]|nr:hypothetical protein [Candidatus Sumerlaeota bacterium]